MVNIIFLVHQFIQINLLQYGKIILKVRMSNAIDSHAYKRIRIKNNLL